MNLAIAEGLQRYRHHSHSAFPVHLPDALDRNDSFGRVGRDAVWIEV